MADKTPWKDKRQPQMGDRPPVYRSLGAITNQTPGKQYPTPRDLSSQLGQDKEGMKTTPSSLKKIMGQ